MSLETIHVYLIVEHSNSFSHRNTKLEKFDEMIEPGIEFYPPFLGLP